MNKELKLQCKDCNDNLTDCTCIKDTVDMKPEPGKETADYIDRHIVQAMVEVAKQKMYSEQEVFVILLKHQSDYRSAVRSTSPLDWSFDIQKWFEKFKKK
jgi:hypothetical protein